MFAADTQSNSQRRTSLIPSPQVNVPSSEPSVGDLCVSTNPRAGELCVDRKNLGNRSFGYLTRESTGPGPSILALGTLVRPTRRVSNFEADVRIGCVCH